MGSEEKIDHTVTNEKKPMEKIINTRVYDYVIRAGMV